MSSFHETYLCDWSKALAPPASHFPVAPKQSRHVLQVRNEQNVLLGHMEALGTTFRNASGRVFAIKIERMNVRICEMQRQMDKNYLHSMVAKYQIPENAQQNRSYESLETIWSWDVIKVEPETFADLFMSPFFEEYEG